MLPHVVVMGFDEAGRVAYEHIYWDQATLLVQVGLLDPALLPVECRTGQATAGPDAPCRRNDPPVALESKIIACGKLLRQRR
jgi:hypothetical protein